ncbi:unnamed protein product [Agarophyton chilense]|eukprot:gb/GEZJ01000771.1/.p1 GENE.gb/GEZJ01000771.1/~~gb/GEZJ01000771.1/.p1  ORF type:complete len:866 (-),score=171.58 gb/GEZJ01000771.1/:4790-7387(-)
MALPTEVPTLMKALDRLQTATTSTDLASFARAVARAADDLDLVCEETTDPSLSTQLSSYIERARLAVSTARKNARAAALKADRAALIEPPTLEQSESQGTAGRLAAEINDALRATAAVVNEEIQRSRVAGDVVDESTRRLKMTSDQHSVFADDIVSGRSTLKSIRRTDLLANLVLVLCFALFFVVAAYVANRRLQNSNIATFVVRPTYKVASLPLRVTAWLFKSSFSAQDYQSAPSQTPMAPDQPDVVRIGHRTPPTTPSTPPQIFSDGAQDHESRGNESLAAIQKPLNVSQSEKLHDTAKKSVAVHHTEQASSHSRIKAVDGAREDPNQPSYARVELDNDVVENARSKAQKPTQTDKTWTALKTSNPSQFRKQELEGKKTVALSEHLVEEIGVGNQKKETDPTASVDRDSDESLEHGFLDATDAEVAENSLEKDEQAITVERNVDAIRDTPTSEHESLEYADVSAGKSDPERSEPIELTSRERKENETVATQSPAVSFDAGDTGKVVEPGLEGESDEQQLGKLLEIPLSPKNQTASSLKKTESSFLETGAQKESDPLKDEDDGIDPSQNPSSIISYNTQNIEKRIQYEEQAELKGEGLESLLQTTIPSENQHSESENMRKEEALAQTGDQGKELLGNKENPTATEQSSVDILDARDMGESVQHDLLDTNHEQKLEHVLGISSLPEDQSPETRILSKEDALTEPKRQTAAQLRDYKHDAVEKIGESTIISTDREHAEEYVEHNLEEPTKERGENLKETSYSVQYEASALGEITSHRLITGEIERISSQAKIDVAEEDATEAKPMGGVVRDEGHRRQPSVFVSTVPEVSYSQLLDASVKGDEHELDDICLAPGTDSELHQVSSVLV